MIERSWRFESSPGHHQVPDTKSLPKDRALGRLFVWRFSNKQDPLPPLRGYFPQREKWPEGLMGTLFSVFHFPREGGDPARRSKFTSVQFGAVRERAILWFDGL